MSLLSKKRKCDTCNKSFTIPKATLSYEEKHKTCTIFCPYCNSRSTHIE